MGKLDWNSKILNLNPDEFESLSYELLHSMGFTNIVQRKGGRDKGIDISADFIRKEPGNMNVTVEKWFFQCKRYSSGISLSNISDSVDWSIAEKANKFAVMSNNHLTTDCRDNIKARLQDAKVGLIEFTEDKFITLLKFNPHIIAAYFPDIDSKEYRNVNNKKITEIVFNLPNELSEKLSNLIITTKDFSDELKEKEIRKFFKEKILQSVDIDPNIRSLIYQKLAVSDFSKGLIKDSLENLDQALLITPKNKFALLDKGIILTILEKWSDAINNCYDKVIDIDPHNKIAWNNKGHCSRMIGKLKGALYCFNKSIELDNNFILARNNKSRILLDNGKYKESLINYLDNLKIKPKSPTTLKGISDLFKELTVLSISMKYIDNALEIDPNYDEAWNSKGHYIDIQNIEGNHDLIKEALECFKKAVEINNSNLIALSNVAICLAKLGNKKEALDIFDKSIKNSGIKTLKTERSKSIVMRLLGDFEGALKVIDEAIIENKNSIDLKELYLQKSVILRLIGKHKKALEFLDNALEMDSKYLEALKVKAEIYREIGNDIIASEIDTKIKKILYEYENIAKDLIELLPKN